MATSCTDIDHPYYKELYQKDSKERYKFFTKEDAKRMKFVSLGEALDFISYGGGNFVGYPFGTKDMTAFIKKWIEKQEPRIDYERVEKGKGWYTYKETGREYFYLWNKFPQQSETPELPRINYKSCPISEEHNSFVIDMGGRLRCSHKKSDKINPDFTRIFVEDGLGTSMKRYNFQENEPEEPTAYDEDNDETYSDIDSPEYAKYLNNKGKFDRGKSVELIDTCYAIIREPKKLYLPLETILDRINCSGDDKSTIHPFPGFMLANYAQAWWEQQGDKKYWKNNHSIDIFKKFKNFVPIGTDD
jgi:hypothetical protein